MARSLKKGPFVSSDVFRKVEEMNATGNEEKKINLRKKRIE